MRTNKMMRIATALMVAALLTTCAISGTFAKYISSTSASDQARVAKWGWGTTSIALDLFDDVYDEGKVDSVGVDGDNVVAPGTAKTYEFKFDPASGFAPEVAYSLTFDVEQAIDADLEAELDWTLKVGDTTTPYATLADLAAAIEAQSVATVAANTANPITFTIGWSWAFETADDGETPAVDELAEGDADDVALGDNVADLSECSITIKLTATQID